ncbi:N,N-dimethylformamidase beta subunit family domain-containing protein [Microbacterium deminutum]|uniref:N,N-dimethylformamidase beta subunit family domain-containing protein n=1 Tax=Microbacterium deminutum TaxID=344164 RepID=UPI0031E0AD40
MPIAVSALLAAFLPAIVLPATPAEAAGPCGPPVTSVIACENMLPGDAPSDWQVTGAGDSTIQGYATSMSVNVGETVHFKINTSAGSYHIDILRMGYYQGNGARKVATGVLPSANLPQSQPACLTDSTTGLIDCGNWTESASWAVPATAVSGVYLAHLVRNDTGGASLIPFVVRNDASTSDIVVQTSDETWQAYNTYGGNSLYSCTISCPPGNPGGYKGAFKVSYNRPWHSPADDSGRSWVMYAEYPMIRWLESNGYDVSYMSGPDVATRGSLLLSHKAFLSVGHDEYWSGDQRANVEAARDHGVNLAFFSGNEVFWKTRWEPSTDATKTPGRTLVSYKETHFDAPTDPQDPPTWTGTWRDPRFSPPADGGRPENALTGQFFIVNSGTTDIQVPGAYAALRLWRNTAAASLTPSQTLTLGSGVGTLGYEWDEDADNGARPAGLFDLSQTTSTSAQVFVDYGTNVATGPATHHLTEYRAPSGALVFGAGTVQWSWGLDGATTGKASDRNMQQATVNVLADMGSQPTTLAGNLVATAASTDTTAPKSTIASPAQGAGISDGSAVTISGTATDTGGGTVAGVEVSTDGGKTWHPARGAASWTYTWIAHGNPTTTIRTRAVDDTGNVEAPSAGVNVNVSCPCSIWGANVTPGLADSGDAQGIEVGVNFTTDTFGTVSGIRFYKSTKNTGTHTGNLWTSSGQLLGRVTFSGETASGWQQASFSQPIAVSPGTTYVASYYAPAGHYAQDSGYLYNAPAPAPDGNDSVDSPPLHALRSTPSNPDGVYSYSASTAFPSSAFNAENYWVDVVFTPSPAPGQVTNVTATPGYSSAAVSWNAPNTGVPTIYTITPYIGTAAQPTTTVVGNPPATSTVVTGLTNGTTYTFTVTASNPNGAGSASAPSSGVTPSATASVVQNGGFESGVSLWTAAGTPPGSASTTTVHTGAGSALLGSLSGAEPTGDGSLSQRVSIPNGTSTLSFWYWPATTDTICSGSACVYDWQEAQIRSTSGTVLASVFKGNSNARVWTPVTFNTSAYAGQTVVLWFTVHQDGSNPPDDTWMYLDDVSLAGSQPTAPSAPTGVTATAGDGQATVSWTAPANGGAPITSYTITPYIGTTPQAPTTITGTPPATTTTVTGLTDGTAYTFTVSALNSIGPGPASAPSSAITPSAPTAPSVPTGVTAIGGNAQATVSWTAPGNGGAPITGYTITPYIGTTAQSPTTFTGTPPAATATVTGLTNGTGYTFTVEATNSIGTSAESARSNTVVPATAPPIAFIQQITSHGVGATRTVTPVSAVTAGDRMIVEVGIWAASHPTISSVTDSAGNTYTSVARFTSSDGTEETVWTAPVTAGGGTKPTITATATASGDVGIAAVEYAGLSNTAGGGAVDVATTATGTTSAATTVFSGATSATTTAGLALGFYADSGFGTSPTPASGFTKRASITGASDMDLLIEDQSVGAGATPNAGAATGANTIWLVSTVVFTAAAGTTPTAPAAPTGITATAGSGQATVSWTAPNNGGSPITGYTVTPYVGAAAQSPTIVTGTPPATAATVSGLVSGTTYTFTVKATNAIGTGPESAPSSGVTPTGGALGQWGSLQTWPLVAIHAIQLNNGKYLLFDGWQNPTPTLVWDPVSNTFTTVNAPASIFCSGNTHMADGRVFVAGGHGTTEIGIKSTTIFDPATGAWTKVADMNAPRWYPSVLPLSDGRFLALSGNSTDASHWADTPEVYNPSSDSWTLLSGVSTSQIHEEEYPFTDLMPNGKVFAMGPSEDVSYVLDVNAQTWTPVGASGVVNGSAVMYRPGKVLYSGGAASVINTATAAAATSVIDLTAPSPTWRHTSPMNTARVYHTLTMLADGKVLAVGGEQTSDQTTVTSGVLSTEIWDPATETWTTGPSMSAARNYHSTAVLMPDGRVLVAGGGHENGLSDAGQYSSQIYSPAYLSNGPRPTISSATASTSYGGTITVNTPDAAGISAVNLVSLGADTHQADMGQHFVPLNFTAGSSSLSVTSPSGAAIAPPGDYMMFIVNSAGVPSVASMVHINASVTSPGVPANVTAAGGSTQATVSWTAPADGGSAITSYTITPYVGGAAQTPTTITGNPPVTTATITGLTNGTAYTFTVTATNAVGTGQPSAASNMVTPGVATPLFVQSVTAHGAGTTTRTVTLPSAITAGNRLIVEVGVWSSSNATVSSVRDSAGNAYTELTHFTASDHTEQSIWSTPITAGGGTKPTITVTATKSSDLGIAALEYAGLSTAAGAGAVQASKTATGTATSNTTVFSAATAASTANGIALGFYADSGFGVSPNPSSGFTARAKIANAGDMDLLVEDQPISTGATANAGATTSAGTIWLMSTIVFKGS